MHAGSIYENQIETFPGAKKQRIDSKNIQFSSSLLSLVNNNGRWPYFPASTVQIAVDHGPQIGAVKPIGSLKAFLIHPFKILKMILNTLVIDRILRPARAVEGIFRRVFSSISGTMLHRDWGGLYSVFTGDRSRTGDPPYGGTNSTNLHLPSAILPLRSVAPDGVYGMRCTPECPSSYGAHSGAGCSLLACRRLASYSRKLKRPACRMAHDT